MNATGGIFNFTGWKPSPRKDGRPKNKAGWLWVPNCSDVASLESLTLGAKMLAELGLRNPNENQMNPLPLPSNPGASLENWVRNEIAMELPNLAPSRRWLVERGEKITKFAQYGHLNDLDAIVASDPNIRITVGRDYHIKPDVTVGLEGAAAVDGLAFLHAAVSCKWTIRSDRVQNIRHEFNQMIRHRRGRQPHLVTVTAEPLPSRLASIARGTGEVDATYHVAFDALDRAVAASSNRGQQEAWDEVVGQRRLKSFHYLADDLERW
ncbi:hypothetical protein GCM10027059_24490 [Myceligenerans halotolerans]